MHVRVAFVTALVAFASRVVGVGPFAGVNLAGCEFGCDIYGNCQNSYCPTPTTFKAQIAHFRQVSNFTIFRLPVGWQYLVNYQLSAPLYEPFTTQYDALLRSCLASGAWCVIDIHNYARWYGGVVGQSGSGQGSPKDADLVDVWARLVRRYKSYKGFGRVMLGIMNEPHDLDINVWAQTVQKVVTAVRRAGAKSNILLLPGTDYSSAQSFVQSSAPALKKIVDVDGTKNKLVFDVHRYYDSNGSGTSAECTSDHVDDTFRPLAEWLQQNKRRAFLTETGGGNTDSCVEKVCTALNFISARKFRQGVFLGWIGWSAGSFGRDYTLSEVPSEEGQDTKLVRECIAGVWKRRT